MREIVSTLEKALIVGLRPEKNIAIGADALAGCYNLVPNEYGLNPRQEIFNFATEFAVDFPFPQFRRLQGGVYAFTRNAVYRYVTKGAFIKTSNWIGWYSPDTADFQDMFLFGGDSLLWGNVFYNDTITRPPGGFKFFACTQFKGQLVIGGAHVPNTITEDIIDRPNMLAWAKVGSLDFSLDLSNEAGYGEASFSGQVLRLIPLGDEIIVYGENGISKMEPTSSPAPSYKITHFSDNAILSPDALAGNNGMHVYIGQDYAIYVIQPRRALSDQGYAPKRLGYSEFIKKCGPEVCVSYDSLCEHWWICGKNAAFILTNNGLGESSITSPCVIRMDGNLYGATKILGSDKAIVKTNDVSFGTRGIKLLTTVEADIESETNADCRVYWKLDYRKEGNIRKPIRLDPRGYCFPMLSGSQFQIELETEDFRTTRVSKLWLKYKVTDKNSIRGAINAGKVAE